MKSINIVGMAILGWLAVAYTDKSYSVMSDEKISSPAVSTLKSDCVCVCCDDCECSEKDGCQECSTEKIKKEVAVEITASTFPRPKNPCPSGPGRK